MNNRFKSPCALLIMGTSYRIEEKHEECGIVAIYSKKGKNVAPYLHRALMALQHRGQDAAGFVILDGKSLVQRKGMGLVSEIFKEKDLGVKGDRGIGHTRYPTTGGFAGPEDIQPSVFKNIAAANNGHVANYEDIKKQLENDDFEVLGSVESETIVRWLSKHEKIETRVKDLMEKFDGAYSIVAMIDAVMFAFRDKHGIRPLVYGENEEFICFASETAALDINNIPYCGDVGGGELIIINDGKIVRQQIQQPNPRHCMFEYVYFSRPDSVINNKEVHGVRKKLGGQLAKEHPVDADVIVPIPDTARTAAESFSEITGIRVEEGLIKNRYIGRTFIMPTQEKRADAVKTKLNTVSGVIKGRKVVLIDDSIVRGTTLREIVKLVKKAGAKEVHLRITCPPIKAPCFYGVDMSTYEELIANNKSIEEIRKFLDADSLGYISIDGLKKAIGLPVCTGCLNEEYMTPVAKKLAKERKSKK